MVLVNIRSVTSSLISYLPYMTALDLVQRCNTMTQSLLLLSIDNTYFSLTNIYCHLLIILPVEFFPATVLENQCPQIRWIISAR